jgi:hypothetical protein
LFDLNTVNISDKLKKHRELRNGLSYTAYMFADFLADYTPLKGKVSPETFVRIAKEAAYDLERGRDGWKRQVICHPLSCKKLLVRDALEKLPAIIEAVFPPRLAKRARKKFDNEPLLLF